MRASAVWLLLLVASIAYADDLPTDAGLEILKEKCGSCHGLGRIVNAAPKPRDDWQSTVERMVDMGIDILPKDEKRAVDYLVRYFGDKVNINTAAAKNLQEEFEIEAAEADAIVRARAVMPFRSFADLGKVPGLDIRKLEPFKRRLVF